MRKILLYGNGYCLNLIESENKETLQTEVKYYYDDYGLDEEFELDDYNIKNSSHKFNFSYADLYNYLIIFVPKIFRDISKEKFIEEIKETNLENLFEKIYHNYLISSYELNELNEYKNLHLIILGRRYSLNKKFKKNFEKKSELVLILNYLISI